MLGNILLLRYTIADIQSNIAGGANIFGEY